MLDGEIALLADEVHVGRERVVGVLGCRRLGFLQKRIDRFACGAVRRRFRRAGVGGEAAVKLVEAVKAFMSDDLWVKRTSQDRGKERGIEYVSNAKLLR